MRFKYYNPNKKNKVAGDCVIRMLTIVTNKSWNDCYWMACEEGRSYDYEPYMRDMSGNMDMRYSRNSYARGRGSNAKRDSIGRYASRYDGRSMHGKSQEELMEEIEMLREKVEKMED